MLQKKNGRTLHLKKGIVVPDHYYKLLLLLIKALISAEVGKKCRAQPCTFYYL